jgi:hypothetical protein
MQEAMQRYAEEVRRTQGLLVQMREDLHSGAVPCHEHDVLAAPGGGGAGTDEMRPPNPASQPWLL